MANFTDEILLYNNIDASVQITSNIITDNTTLHIKIKIPVITKHVNKWACNDTQKIKDFLSKKFYSLCKHHSGNILQVT